MARTSAGGIQPVEIQNSTYIYAEDGQSSDTYAITLTPAPSAYTVGQMFLFKANTANTGACSLNVNGLGAKTIKKHKGEDLVDNDIKEDSVVSVVYDGTNFQMISMLSNAPAGSGDMTKAVYDTNNDGIVNEADAVEGTGVLSTGESGGTKFLREDGDGSSSWQTPSYPTRDSLGLDTDDTVTFANLSGNNTGDQTLPTRDSLGLDTDDTPDFASVSLSKTAGNNRSLLLKTGTENRLEIGASSGAETGSDAGSDLFVNTYDDDGTYKATPIYMSRANGDITFTGKLNVPSVELGHASDTTIARVSAGVVSVEGKNIALNGTGETLTTGTIELGAASDTTISRVSAGVIAVEGVNVLTTAGGTLTGNITLGENTSVDLDPALSADGKYTGTCITGTAGAALAFGDIVYFNSSSKWVLADADTAAAGGSCMLGVVVLAASGDTEPTKVLLHGNVRADTAFPTFTVGGAIYLSTTDGDVTQTAPTGADDVVRVVGHALTADSMVFMPSPSHITHVGA